MIKEFDFKKTAKELFDDIEKLPIKNTPNLRKVRQKYSKKLAQATPEQILDFVRYFIGKYDHRWIVFEIIHCHKTAISIIGVKELEEFGIHINSWGASDVFAGYIAGPAWRNGQVPDGLIMTWAGSPDFWRRRTALVCTVALNRRSAGGQGDVHRTLKICHVLAADKNDMVIKALSWALRECIPHDPESVRKFIGEHESVLASRVKREVKNKLTTGVKNPRRKVD
ncbi:MAG: DNA alkylation repair protein [Candidatus Aminicenantes bacterium]|nr:DNA alkylation repair protein [Candidatus Aminicenantes bacterium]